MTGVAQKVPFSATEPYRFCPADGTRLEIPRHEGGGARCPLCGRSWYRSSAPAVGAAIVRDGERYAVELVQELGSKDGLVTSEGTLYPLLSRLRREGVVETTWRESPGGPPRRRSPRAAASAPAAASRARAPSPPPGAGRPG